MEECLSFVNIIRVTNFIKKKQQNITNCTQNLTVFHNFFFFFNNFFLIFPETSLSHNAVPDTAIATTARSETVQSKFAVDYDRLIENIKDLNVLAGEGVSKIHHTNDGARLRVNYSSFESI